MPMSSPEVQQHKSRQSVWYKYHSVWTCVSAVAGLSVLTGVLPGLGVILDHTRAKHPLAELVKGVQQGAIVGAEQRPPLLCRGRRPVRVPPRQPLQEKCLEVPGIGTFS